MPLHRSMLPPSHCFEDEGSVTRCGGTPTLHITELKLGVCLNIRETLSGKARTTVQAQTFLQTGNSTAPFSSFLPMELQVSRMQKESIFVCLTRGSNLNLGTENRKTVDIYLSFNYVATLGSQYANRKMQKKIPMVQLI